MMDTDIGNSELMLNRFSIFCFRRNDCSLLLNTEQKINNICVSRFRILLFIYKKYVSYISLKYSEILG